MVLNLSLFKTIFSLFLLSIYKMVDSMDIYKSLNNDIRTVMQNPKMLKFVSDHLKTKKIYNHGTKNYLIY